MKTITRLLGKVINCELAKAMVTLGNKCGVNTRALLTSMDTPLGRAAGNWLEVKESVQCLEPDNNEAPADLRELVLACAAQLLVQTGKARTEKAGREKAARCLASGTPRKKWNEMLAAQGADLMAFNKKLALDHTAPVVLDVKAPKAGYVSRCDARILGEVIRDLGGGRATKESVINYDAGIDYLAKPGQKVEAGSLLARLHAADPQAAQKAAHLVLTGIEISPRAPRVPRLIQKII